jgi:hypothetical protein
MGGNRAAHYRLGQKCKRIWVCEYRLPICFMEEMSPIPSWAGFYYNEAEVLVFSIDRHVCARDVEALY